MINWDSFDPNMRALESRILCIPYFSSWKVRIWLPESASILRRITSQIRGFRGDEALYSLCRGMFPLYIELQAHWDYTEMTISLCYFFQGKGLRKNADAFCLQYQHGLRYVRRSSVDNQTYLLIWAQRNRTWCPHLYYLYELLFIMTS